MSNRIAVTAEIFIGSADGRLVRGSSVEAIAELWFGRFQGPVTVKDKGNDTYAVLKDDKIIGRIRVVEVRIAR